MDNHHKIVTWVHLGVGALGTGLGILMVAFGFFKGLVHGDEEAFGWSAAVGSMLAVFAIPWLVGGWALLKGRPWGRVVLSVAAVILLPAFPIGTAWGGYTLWVLLHPERVRRSTSGGPAPRPPDPHSGGGAAESPRAGGAGIAETPRVAG